MTRAIPAPPEQSTVLVAERVLVMGAADSFGLRETLERGRLCSAG